MDKKNYLVYSSLQKNTVRICLLVTDNIQRGKPLNDVMIKYQDVILVCKPSRQSFVLEPVKKIMPIYIVSKHEATEIQGTEVL